MRNIHAMGALAMMVGILAAAPPDPRGIRFEMLHDDDLLSPRVAPQRRVPPVPAPRRREDATATIAAAEAKRHRKAAKRLALTKASSP